jgi:hypothetical protein
MERNGLSRDNVKEERDLMEEHVETRKRNEIDTIIITPLDPRSS